MEAGPLSQIVTCTSARKMWDKLRMIYERKSNAAGTVFLLKIRGSMMKFLSRMQNLVSEMAQISEDIPENMVITKMIMPEQIKRFTSAWGISC